MKTLILLALAAASLFAQARGKSEFSFGIGSQVAGARETAALSFGYAAGLNESTALSFSYAFAEPARSQAVHEFAVGPRLRAAALSLTPLIGLSRDPKDTTLVAGAAVAADVPIRSNFGGRFEARYLAGKNGVRSTVLAVGAYLRR